MKRSRHMGPNPERLGSHPLSGPGRRSRRNGWAGAAGAVWVLWVMASGGLGQESINPGPGRKEPARPEAPPAGAGTAAVMTRGQTPDFGAFRIILDRNIFNASRSGARPGPARPTRRPTRVDTLALVGTLENGPNRVAFFDGSSSDYRKAVRPGEEVAGLTVQEIRFDRVYLVQESQRWELPVGGTLRREEEGEWQVSDAGPTVWTARGRDDQPDGAGRSSRTGDGAATAAGSGQADEVLRKLMERRAREEQ